MTIDRRVITIEKDREETGMPYEIEESKDKDARWLKKGNRSYCGYKGFAVTDTDDGYILSTKAEPANVSEMNKLAALKSGITAAVIYTDKGCSSQENRTLLKGKHEDGIMFKAARNKPLTGMQKLINKLISRKRYIAEQCHGTLKRSFRFTRASYMTRGKVDGQLCLKAICFNLLKAYNKAAVLQPAY